MSEEIITQICSRKDCHLSGQKQDINNFPFRKGDNIYRKKCKNCQNIDNKNKRIKNQNNSNRINISIQIKKCLNLSCSIKTDQYVNPDNNLSDFYWNDVNNNYNTECKTCRSQYKKKKTKDNKNNSNRSNITIQIKKCSNLNCSIKHDQYVNPNDELSDFRWQNNSNNYNLICKTCNSQYSKQKIQENKNNSNRSNIPVQIKKCSNLNCSIKHNQYINPNDELCDFKWSNQLNNYRLQCKTCICIKNTKYVKNRYQNDPIFKLRINISYSICQALKNNNSSKNGLSIIKYLPYTIKELKAHIENLFEPWMNWKNHGKYISNTWNDNDLSTWKWQLDHIIPHSTFNYTSMDDQKFKDCWTLSNLRPYSAKQNILDGNRR